MLKIHTYHTVGNFLVASRVRKNNFRQVQSNTKHVYVICTMTSLDQGHTALMNAL